MLNRPGYKGQVIILSPLRGNEDIGYLAPLLGSEIFLCPPPFPLPPPPLAVINSQFSIVPLLFSVGDD